MSYPKVASEHETILKLQEGFSIARFGDGELKMVDGKEYIREPANRKLSKELRKTLHEHHERCIIGIPTMNPEGPKIQSWLRHKRRFEQLIPPGVYYSAFISRPDSAPWIDEHDFAYAYQSLWRGKRVAVVCEEEGSALRAIRFGAASIEHIVCPHSKAYAGITALERAVMRSKPDIAFLSVGVTATCLANRLASRGIQAIDFGSGGAFLARLLKDVQ